MVWVEPQPIFCFLHLCPLSVSCILRMEERTSSHILCQGLTNYAPWAKSSLSHVCIKECTLIHLQSVYGCLLTVRAELNSCNRYCMAHKAWSRHCLPLYKQSWPFNSCGSFLRAKKLLSYNVGKSLDISLGHIAVNKAICGHIMPNW